MRAFLATRLCPAEGLTVPQMAGWSVGAGMEYQHDVFVRERDQTPP
jgi:hypothetical protein